MREAGLSEIVEPAQSQISADVSAGLEWATMEYLYDLTQEYYQVISETTTYANAPGPWRRRSLRWLPVKPPLPHCWMTA